MRWLVVMVVLSSAGVARAATRLCFGPPKGPAIAAPPDPSFVVASHEAVALAHNERATAIDAYWSKVTVHAKPGDTFVRDIGCDRKRFRVTARWVNRGSAPVPFEVELGAGGETAIVRWHAGTQHTWTRIDWAYRTEDLDTDLHGSELVEEAARQRDVSEAYLDAAPTVAVIHLRLTRFHLDGTQQIWRGWLHRDAGAMRIGTGPAPAPATPTVEPGPCTSAGRAVPTTPTFRTWGGSTPRFVAMACDGRLLPVTRAIGDEPMLHVATTVVARPGERYWLRRLPLAPGAPTEPLLVATAERYLDVAPVVARAAAPGCSARLDIADEGTWDELEVASVAVDGSNAAADERHRSLAEDIGVSTSIASPQLVRITPIWGSQRGRSWFGWVHSEGCDTASFGVALPSAPASAPIVRTDVPSSSRPPTLAILALLGLALGWLVLRRLASVV